MEACWELPPITEERGLADRTDGLIVVDFETTHHRINFLGDIVLLIVRRWCPTAEAITSNLGENSFASTTSSKS
eukprot:scaffold190927_cov56-Attheya_sp.AAC.2